jgi:hypothetical protein
MLVEFGLSLLHNLACSQELCPALRKQAYWSVLAYVDPKVNDMNRVITAVQLIELINPENNLCEFYYPESLFITLSDLVGRAYYSQSEGLFRVHFKKDNTGTTTGADYVLICLIVLSRAPFYQCRVTDIVREREKQIKLFLQKGGKFEWLRTVELLNLLRCHKCEKCLDGRLAARLLKDYGPDEEDTLNRPQQRPIEAPPGMPLYRREKTLRAIHLEKAGAEKGKGCLYADACRRYLRTIGVSGSFTLYYTKR